MQTNPEQWAVELWRSASAQGAKAWYDTPGDPSAKTSAEDATAATLIQAAFAEREARNHAQHRETLAVLQTAHESEVVMQAKIDRLADLLAKACGDIAALLVFGNREGDIRSWTAEYAEALNEHDPALKDRTHG